MATLAGKRSITKNKTEQKINLRTLLGRKPTNEEKTLFAELSIELINNRTLDGDNVDGNKFSATAPYSEAYAAKKGVPINAVDMFLKGDMLDSIKTLSETRDTVSIGIQGGLEAKKSHRHNTGSKGMPKREFFGVTKKEADKIVDTIKSDTVEAAEVSGFSLAELRAALELLDIEQVE
jgi:hypothetical protein